MMYGLETRLYCIKLGKQKTNKGRTKIENNIDFFLYVAQMTKEIKKDSHLKQTPLNPLRMKKNGVGRKLCKIRRRR